MTVKIISALKSFLVTIICLLFLSFTAHSQSPPEPTHEFRAVWIATVDNIDFPTKKNLTVEEQKAELIRNLDLARELKLNAVIFQVRPMCDALYDSKIEPWSEYLTGAMGKSQNFDPLQFIIAEAHRRGILVHAWFNPYRAYHPSAKTVSENHISKQRPELVVKYGKYLWLDPGEPDVQEYSLRVVLDVVRRYDLDGVHFDDYFYPYPEKDSQGNRIDFPDEISWQKYQKTGGKLLREEWRRKNVNDFVQSVGREIKRLKPQVLYGISPFGIWQPMPEKNITGFNAFNELYADARRWLQEGTVDYLSPQLYWETARKGQSYPVLLDWWQNQNVKKRHLWTGIATYRINSNPNFTAGEIGNQINVSQQFQQTPGNIHFSFKSLRNDLGGIQELLKSTLYKTDAVIPQSSWIKARKLVAPKVEIKNEAGTLKISWREQGTLRAFWFVVYAKDKNGWSNMIVPAMTTSIQLSSKRQITHVAVISVDRLGNKSPIKQIMLP